MRLTQEQFISKAREVHGDTYDYSKSLYVRTHDKVEIGCPEGHYFWMSPANHYHKNPQGCPICSGKGPGKDKVSIFLRKAAIRWPSGFEYGDDYINSRTPMTMTCNIHNETCMQSPSGHLDGKNPCTMCQADKKRLGKPSPYNTTKALRGDFNYPSYVYLIRLKNEIESFLKIGISKDVSIRKREFQQKGYEVEVIKTQYFESCNDAVLVEKLHHVFFEEHSYEPSTRFKGYYECFSEDILEEAMARLELNDLWLQNPRLGSSIRP